MLVCKKYAKNRPSMSHDGSTSHHHPHQHVIRHADEVLEEVWWALKNAVAGVDENKDAFATAGGYDTAMRICHILSQHAGLMRQVWWTLANATTSPANSRKFVEAKGFECARDVSLLHVRDVEVVHRVWSAVARANEHDGQGAEARQAFRNMHGLAALGHSQMKNLDTNSPACQAIRRAMEAVGTGSTAPEEHVGGSGEATSTAAVPSEKVSDSA